MNAGVHQGDRERASSIVLNLAEPDTKVERKKMYANPYFSLK